MNLRESVLSKPHVYSFFQRVISRKGINERMISDFLKPFEGMKVLDVGSGTSKILTNLPECIYVAVDHNDKYIQQAKREFGGRGTFFCAEVSDIKKFVEHKFDRILILRVLHHLSDTQVTKLLGECAGLLNEGGIILSLDVAFTHEQNWIARLLASYDRGRFVRRPEEYGQLISERLNIVRTEVIEGMLRIPYTHVVFSFTNIS
jgi:ubiquinone/menaquinone biosynthesis C-methylase UbiE